MTTDPLRESKVQDWEQARRSAFIQDVLSAFTRRPTDLLPFEEVRQQLRLINAQYLGLRDVPLDQIVLSRRADVVSRSDGGGSMDWWQKEVVCRP